MTNRIPKLYGKKEKMKSNNTKKKKKKNKNKGVCISDNKNKKTKTITKKEEDPIFQLIPSTTGTTKTDCDTIPKTLTQLIQETLAFKKHLETHMKPNQDFKFLLNSVDNVIYMLDVYCRETKPPPFNWNNLQFPKSYIESLKISSHHDKEAMSKHAEIGFKVLNCGIVLPKFDAHGLDQVNSVTGSETRKADAPWLDLHRKHPQSVNLSLNGKEKAIWLEFVELDKGNPEVEVICFKFVEEVTRSIELDHPIVTVIRDFAVAAFNEACEMLVKKNEHNNLHDCESMECKYLKISEGYYFYMTIEAIEEGNLGVYETQVACANDGSRWTLTNFVLTDRKPLGTRAMAITHFSCLRSLCKALDDVTDEKVYELRKIIHRGIEREEHGLAMYILCCVLEFRTETIKGLHRELSLGLRFLFSPNCSRTTNPDVWSHPENYFHSGMVRRSRGYDFHNPFGMGRVHYYNPFGVGSVWWCSASKSNLVADVVGRESTVCL